MKCFFRNTGYRRYLIATSVSRIGSGIRFVTFTWLAMKLAHFNYAVALTLLFEALPGLLLSQIVGVYVDRIDKRILATLVNLFQVFILITIPILSWLETLTIGILYLVIFFLATGDILYRTIRVGLVRELVPENTLLNANSISAMGEQIGLTVGAALAGLVIAWYSTNVAILVYVFCLLFGALHFWRVRKGYKVLDQHLERKPKGWKSLWMEIHAGHSYIQQHPDIIPIYLMLLMLISILRTINVLLPPFADDVLKVGSEGFGYIDSAFAVGAIVGSILLPRLRRYYEENFIMNIGVNGLAASLILFSTSFSLWMAILGYLLIGVTYQVWILNQTQAQKSVDLSYQGRVQTTFTFFSSIASILIYGVMGLLSEIVSQRWLYASQGLMLLLVWLGVSRLTKRNWKQSLTITREKNIT